jgi:hypothetical protein
MTGTSICHVGTINTRGLPAVSPPARAAAVHRWTTTNSPKQSWKITTPFSIRLARSVVTSLHRSTVQFVRPLCTDVRIRADLSRALSVAWAATRCSGVATCLLPSWHLPERMEIASQSRRLPLPYKTTGILHRHSTRPGCEDGDGQERETAGGRTRAVAGRCSLTAGAVQAYDFWAASGTATSDWTKHAVPGLVTTGDAQPLLV